ncbi:MAG: permease-like cell division protein FtsX [Eubacteriales bacterium]
MVKINTWKNFFRDTFSNIKRNSLMSIASIVSIIAALVILGIFLVIAFNIKHITQEMEEQLELKVFLSQDVTEDQKLAIEENLKTNDFILSYTFENKEKALTNMSNQLGQYENILKGLEDDNPLPEAFIVKVKDAEQIRALNDALIRLEGVDDINYGESYVDALMNFNNFANVISIVILIILTGISLFIIYNTIKLTVFARRKEINIMKYVGATNWYIRLPFIIEGSLLGIVGAALAVLVIRNAYYYLIGLIQGQSVLMMGISFAAPQEIIPSIAGYFLLYGLLVGAIGSMFSIRKFLNV